MVIVRDLACRELVELVTEYLEGALSPDLCASFEAHLEVCPGCHLYLGQMRLMVRALHHQGNGSLPAASRDELLRRFRDWQRSRGVEPPVGEGSSGRGD